MATWKFLILFGLILSSGLYKVYAEDDAEDSTEVEDEDDDYADADRAHLVVRKTIDQDLGVQGRNLTFTIELHNAGTSTASSVEIVDTLPPAGMELVDGSITASFERIEPGSSVKHTYVLKAVTGSTPYYFEAAKVTYKAEAASSDEQVSYSSMPAIYVMTPQEQIQRYALIVGNYATLGLAKTPADWRNLAIVLVVVGSAVGINSAVKGASTARTNQRRKKALESLEKEQ